MVDWFVLLTPILMLAVIALLAFAGCSFHEGVAVPAAPTNLQASAGDGQVTVSWVASTGADSSTLYTLYRTTPDTADPMVTIPGLSNPYPDSAVVNGTKYCYEVAAKNSSGESGYSNQDCATPQHPFVTSEMLGQIRNDFNGFVGMKIQVLGSPLSIYALGRYLLPGNGGMHEIKIVDAASKNDVTGGNVTVNTAAPGTPFVYAGFVHANLPSPVPLKANTAYYIVTHEQIGGDEWYDDINTTVVTQPDAMVRSSVYYNDMSPGYVEQTPGAHSYGPVNFLYTL
jgi:hypothetical protein